MQILFIWPKPPNLIFEEYDRNRSILSIVMSKILSFPKPLTFPILAAVTPEEHNIEIIEGGPREIDFDKKYDIVGITCTTRYALWAYKIADEFRKRGVFVILGGWHA